MNQIVLLLSLVFPANTLVIFFALAALIIGVVIIETNLISGISFFYIASSLLAFILAGDKIQILTYIGFFLDSIVLQNILLKILYTVDSCLWSLSYL